MRVHKDRFRRPLQVEFAERIRPIFDDFHLLRMEGDYEYPHHQHANYEAILVERGPYRCELNGAELELSTGQVLLIKPGDWHSDHLRDGQRQYVLHFRLKDVAGEPPPPPVFHVKVAPAAQICRGNYASEAWCLRELRLEAERAGAHAAAVQDGLLTALFWRIIRGLAPHALSEEFRRLPADEVQRDKLARIFSQYLGSNPDVTTLARAAGISARHLRDQCVRFFGVPPARLLLRLKMERAEELLRSRGLRVKEVSETLGFANPYHFSTAFRRTRGRSPRSVREAHHDRSAVPA